MTIKLYTTNTEVSRISALSSGKIDKYKYLTGKEILPSDKKLIEQANFTCYPLDKFFKKQIKTIEDQRRKQVEGLVVLNSMERQRKKQNQSKEFFKMLGNN